MRLWYDEGGPGQSTDLGSLLAVTKIISRGMVGFPWPSAVQPTRLREGSLVVCEDAGPELGRSPPSHHAYGQLGWQTTPSGRRPQRRACCAAARGLALSDRAVQRIALDTLGETSMF